MKPENLTFLVKFDLEGQGQLIPKTIRTLTKVLCTSGPNLVVQACTGDELSRGQAQNVVKFDFEIKLEVKVNHTQNNRDLKQGLLHLRSKFGDPSLNGRWVIARTNLVTDGRKDWRTERQTQATTIPG